MKRLNIFTFCMAAAAGFMMTPAHAEQANFTPHHLVPAQDYAPYAEQLDAQSKLDLRSYLEYEQREPCQGYQRAPRGFFHDGCDLDYRRPQQDTVAAKKMQMEPMKLRPVISDYTIYFDFDKADIRPSEEPTLDKVAREINRYKPYEITVEGHTDRAGSAEYNLQLSQRRSQAVSQALTRRGIANRILDRQALGEKAPAVRTKDGIRLQENRRVVIQFRK